MAVLLLVLFPVLLMFKPPMAFAALGAAIVLIVHGKTSAAQRPTPVRTDDNAI